MGGGSLVAGKVGYAVSCAVAAVLLTVSGYAYHLVSLTQSIGGGIDLGSGPQIGAQNILVLGLESRTDYQGNTLSAGLLAAMHAGSVYGVNHGVGGQATNTMILIHIFDGGQKAVGFSIPRDDWVTYPEPYDGQSAGKIDQAYGLAYAESLGKTVNSSMSSAQRYLEANQAGQAATVATVEMVTGQKVNHFAEVNLAGFYYLAQSFGGITVCVKSWNGGQNLHDYNSGFNAVLDGYSMKKGGSQYLHLKAPQALAFVRERDNLPNGDLDRTHRQQAVIDYVIWKLKSDGILGDLTTATNLLSTAKQYIITDAKWNLLDFSTNMRALSGKNLSFYTAPIVGYATIAGQSANQIDIPTIQAAIKEKFTAPAKATKKSAAKSKSAKKAAPIPPASSVTVDVYNGAGVSGLAGGVSQALVAKGYKAGLVTNASAQSQTVTAGTQVFYGKGTSANAEKIAKYFGATAKALTTLTAGHVEVLLGTGSTVVPGSLTQSPTSSASSSSSSSASASPTSAGDNGAVGGAVAVAAKARYGVPCVY
jgi:LCP family protein required for cell wall assembly